MGIFTRYALDWADFNRSSSASQLAPCSFGSLRAISLFFESSGSGVLDWCCPNFRISNPGANTVCDGCFLDSEFFVIGIEQIWLKIQTFGLNIENQRILDHIVAKASVFPEESKFPPVTFRGMVTFASYN